MNYLTDHDLREFRHFCENATNSQLQNIYSKEKEGAKTKKERIAYQAIALGELKRRGLDAEGGWSEKDEGDYVAQLRGR